MSNWISVDERLPYKHKPVIGACFYGYDIEPDAAVVYHDGDKWVVVTDMLKASNYDGYAEISLDAQPTHWMPLPEPPVEIDG